MSLTVVIVSPFRSITSRELASAVPVTRDKWLGGRGRAERLGDPGRGRGLGQAKELGEMKEMRG